MLDKATVLTTIFTITDDVGNGGLRGAEKPWISTLHKSLRRDRMQQPVL